LPLILFVKSLAETQSRTLSKTWGDMMMNERFLAIVMGGLSAGFIGWGLAPGNGVLFAQQYSSLKKTHIYRTVENHPIRLDVYHHPGKVPQPMLLWIHGGALIFGHRGTIHPEQVDLYLNAGFTVVSIDYRLAPESKLPEILDDLEAAYRWVRQEAPHLYSVDGSRIAVIGHSAGGYLTLVSGYRLQPRPQALVSFYGYGDIIGEWYTRPSPTYLKDRFRKLSPKKSAGLFTSIAGKTGNGPWK
jgi:acetyl esterase/lipase